MDFETFIRAHGHGFTPYIYMHGRSHANSANVNVLTCVWPHGRAHVRTLELLHARAFIPIEVYTPSDTHMRLHIYASVLSHVYLARSCPALAFIRMEVRAHAHSKACSRLFVA